MLTLLVVLAVAGILFLAAVVATQDTEVLVDAPPDGPDVELPPGRLVAEDLRAVRFAMVFRGYRMRQVDEVLDRLGEEIAGRDQRIADLERVLAEIVAPAVDQVEAQQVAAPADAASSVDAATEGWAAPVPEGAAPDHDDAGLTPFAPSAQAPGLDLPTGPAAVALPGSPHDVTSFQLPPAADEPGPPSYDELAEPFGAEMLVEDTESADAEPAPNRERGDTATASGEADAIEGSDEAVAAELAAELAWPGPVDDSTEATGSAVVADVTDVGDVTDLNHLSVPADWAAVPEPTEGAAPADAGATNHDVGQQARTETPLTSSAEESGAAVGHPSAEESSAAVGHPSAEESGADAGHPSAEESGAAAGHPSAEESSAAVGHPSAEESSAAVGHPSAEESSAREPERVTPELTSLPATPPAPAPWSPEGGAAEAPSTRDAPETGSGGGGPSGEAEPSAVPGTRHLEDDLLFPEIQASEPAAPDAPEATEDEGPVAPAPRAEE